MATNESWNARSRSVPRLRPSPVNGNVNTSRRINVQPQVFEQPKSIDDRIKEILTTHSTMLDNYLKYVWTDLFNHKDMKLTADNRGAVLSKLRSKVEKTLVKQIGELQSSSDQQAKNDADIRPGRFDNRNAGEHMRSPPVVPTPVRDNLPLVGSPVSLQFGVSSINSQIADLFQSLKSLPPMNKYGPMSGNCDRETTRMENFLKLSFDFQNIPGQFIVQGVQSFRLNKPVDSLPFDEIIQFPYEGADTNRSFMMNINEILQWQKSYRVYAAKDQPGITKQFLIRALQGQSRYGAEAFLMKFVVRVSQCPILMEFDGEIIPRTLNESWPNNIKLVSVTGIDFAGRIHDVDDIRTYVTNWRDVYETDHQTDQLLVYNGRDFHRQINAPRGQLNGDLLLRDLKRMARLRLQACDLEQVQIVVETGIGLGVFAGKYIGVDDRVRVSSALAVRQVLEEDGKSYRHIKAVVFALPIFENDVRNGQRNDTFNAFERVFRKDDYRGSIPVLIIDQDMHRLTVAIARRGLRVSELNPADSHGVFGEYWQNRGPAVEEKLALTTLGLLVQHHLINPHVRNTANYFLI